MSETDAPVVLDTTAGKFTLKEHRLQREGLECSVLHVAAILTEEDETRAIVRKTNRLPYGVSLWPSAIALAHELAARPREFPGRGVLELGAGVGLPGIVAATLGARVVQTDREELALHVCRLNADRNPQAAIELRLADWTDWSDTDRYDWILAADVLYGDAIHPHLRKIFETNLGPNGRVLLADPFRPSAITFLEALEADGWGVRFSRWDVGDEETPRPVGVFELTPPRPGM